MSKDIKNQMLEILARKKATQQDNVNGFNPAEVKPLKAKKGFNKPNMLRKTGRGS